MKKILRAFSYIVLLTILFLSYARGEYLDDLTDVLIEERDYCWQSYGEHYERTMTFAECLDNAEQFSDGTQVYVPVSEILRCKEYLQTVQE